MKKLIILFFSLGLLYIGVEWLRKEFQGKDAHYQNEITKIKQESLLQEKSLNEKLALLEEENKNIQSQLAEKKESEKIYTFLVGGDLMFDRGVEKKIKSLDKNYAFAFAEIFDYLKEQDFVFANLEGSLSDVGADQGGKYSFRFEEEVAGALSHAGFDMLSLANNHILDWGQNSVCATRKNLDEFEIISVGAGCNKKEANQEKIIELGNTKIAVLAYSEFHPGWSWATDTKPGMSEWKPEQIKEKISSLKASENIDLVFVSVHWGEEYKDRAPERIVKLGQSFVDAGADVIIGHHPHVDQEIERYGDGWVIYSLGNFVFDQSWSENTMEGLLAEIKIQNKRVYDIVPKFIDLNKNYQPVLRK